MSVISSLYESDSKYQDEVENKSQYELDKKNIDIPQNIKKHKLEGSNPNGRTK